MKRLWDMIKWNYYLLWRRKNWFMTDCYVFFNVLRKKLKYGWDYDDNPLEKDNITE
ncbi:MAG TPA: hypothetical protein VFM99_10160 [Chitinophagales bacterium]|nr:hypothetical protein [Chitinophagales bacterium]